MNYGINEDEETPIEEGEVLIITEGDYSDYTVRAVMVAKKRFTAKDEKERYIANVKEPRNRTTEGFLGFLVKNGLAEDVASKRELHYDWGLWGWMTKEERAKSEKC